MKPMDFFVWQGRSRGFERHGEAGNAWGTAPRLRNGIALQGKTPFVRRRSGTGLQAGVRAASAGGVNSESIDDECNAGRRKKTRFHGAFMGWDWY